MKNLKQIIHLRLEQHRISIKDHSQKELKEMLINLYNDLNNRGYSDKEIYFAINEELVQGIKRNLDKLNKKRGLK